MNQRNKLLAGSSLLALLGASPAWGAPPAASNPRRDLERLEQIELIREAAKETLQRAKRALERATALDGKDPAHARLALQTANEWLQVARDLNRALVAERRVRERQRELGALLTQLKTGRSMLDDGIRRRRRLEVLVERLERADGAASAPEQPAAEKNVDAQ